MKRRLRLGICDFWPSHRVESCRIVQLLRTRFDIEISDQPDVLLYSLFGEQHYRYRCRRIFFSGEPIGPDWTECDYALTSFVIDDPRHHRLPLFWLKGEMGGLIKSAIDPERILRSKTKFCNFVFSNPKCETRNRFFDRLSRYKRVDAGGKVRNNLGFCVPNKREFIQPYKFTIAFENSSHAGYTTEKIVEPIWVNSLPIYWGNPLIHLDFNRQSFISFHDYGSLDALVERVIQVDQDDDLYMQYLSQPWFAENRIPEHLQGEAVLDWFERALFTPITPVAQRVSVPLFRRARSTWRSARSWFRRQLSPARVR